MDNTSNIRSLSPEQGKISKQSRIHTFFACGFGKVGQLRMRRWKRRSDGRVVFTHFSLPTRHENKFSLSLTLQLCFLLLFTWSQLCQTCATAFLALSLATHAHMNIHCSLWCQWINVSKEGPAEMCRWLMCWLKHFCTGCGSLKVNVLLFFRRGAQAVNYQSPAQPFFKGDHLQGSSLTSSRQSAVVQVSFWVFSASVTQMESETGWAGTARRENKGKMKGKAGKMNSSIFDILPIGAYQFLLPHPAPSHSCQQSPKP